MTVLECCQEVDEMLVLQIKLRRSD